MKSISISALCIFFTLLATVLGRPSSNKEASKEKEPECVVLKSVKLSFYGRSNHKDPIAYPECGRRIPGGIGTYESPLTMASAPGEFAKCEIVYVPYLLKYVRFEDLCLDCVKDYAKGKQHIQIWTGNSMAGGLEQTNCIKDFTPSYAMPAIRYPGKALVVDKEKLYHWGTKDPCRLDHRYKVVNPNAFCFDKKEKASDHEQDQKNSAAAMRHPYPRPADEQPIQIPAPAPAPAPPQVQALAQDQEVYYNPEDTGWKLQEDTAP